MPARRLVVAAASAFVLLSALSSVGADARTTTTTKRRTTTTEERPHQRRATTTTTRRRPTSSTTPARSSTTATSRATTTSTAAPAARASSEDEPEATTSTTASPSVKTGRFVVVLKKGNRGVTVAEEHKRTHGVKVQRAFGHAIRGYAAEIPLDELDAVKKDKRVAYVSKAVPMTKTAQILPWGVEKVSRTGNDWSSTRPGDGTGAVSMDVYVIDTGIAAHADLSGGTEFNAKGGPNTDCDGHGTHMAGIAGALDNGGGVVGVAPGVRLHGVKVLDCGGRGTDLDALAGLEWVIAHGAHPSVITISFGGPISRPFDDGIRRAVGAGFVITIAAGNSHKNACNMSPAHMGSLAGVITVGGTTNRDRVAGFSNGGPCVDVYAPGVGIDSTYLNGGFARATGTSASAPHVAGVAALYLAGSGSDAPADAEAAIKANAVRIGSARRGVLRASSAAF